MSFGGIKDYAIIHLDFANKKYFIFKYKRDRRLTAKSAWVLIRNTKADIVGNLPYGSNLDYYFDILNQFGLDSKYSDRYMSFPDHV